MDRRGASGIGMESLGYILLCILVFVGGLFFVNSYDNGSFLLEDFYAKEIANIINTAKPGEEYKLDVTQLAVIAIKNGKPLRETIYVDNVNNQIRVSSRLNAGIQYGFFNDVDIVDFDVLGPSGSANTAQFIFKVKERQRDEK
jgi:hypothetical protein